MEKRKTMLSSLLKVNRQVYFFLACQIIAQPISWAIAADFETVYRSALKNSPELAKVNANADETAAVYQASISKFLPRAGVESRYEMFDSDFEKVKGGTANAFISWNVFNGFKDIQSRKSLGAESKATSLEKERLEMNLKWITMAKYTKAKVMQENVQSYKNVILSNLKNLETVKIRRASGRLSDADFLEFELFDSKLKQDLVSLETEAKATLADLEAFSGISPIGQLETKLEPKRLLLDELNLIDLVSSDKSKLQESRLRVDAFEARKSLATGGFLPEVNMIGTYGSLGLRETTVSPETSIGITAKWELFSGLETINDRIVANAQFVKAKAELDGTKINNLSRAEQLRSILQSILVRYDFEEKNKKNIERFLKTVQEEYRRGVKNSNDLKSALELVLDTQINRASLRADYFAARAELQEIIGIELKEQ